MHLLKGRRPKQGWRTSLPVQFHYRNTFLRASLAQPCANTGSQFCKHLRANLTSSTTEVPGTTHGYKVKHMRKYLQDQGLAILTRIHRANSCSWFWSHLSQLCAGAPLLKVRALQQVWPSACSEGTPNHRLLCLSLNSSPKRPCASGSPVASSLAKSATGGQHLLEGGRETSKEDWGGRTNTS